MSAPVLSAAERDTIDGELRSYKRDDMTDLPVPFVKGFERGWLACREWAEERERQLRETVADAERMHATIAGQLRPFKLEMESIVQPSAIIARLIERERVLREALEFYADPDTYYGIGMAGDSPCGAFLDDLDDAHDPGYPKPGKRARAALASPTPHPSHELREVLAELVRLRRLKEADPVQYQQEGADAKAAAWADAEDALASPTPQS